MLGSTTENGAGGASLNVGGNNETVLSVSPALEIGTQYKWADGTLLRPYVRGGATFFGNNDFSLLASFEGAPAGVGPFQISTKTDDVVADVGAGLDWIGRGGTELKLFYEGRIGDLVSEQSGGVKASVPFLKLGIARLLWVRSGSSEHVRCTSASSLRPDDLERRPKCL